MAVGAGDGPDGTGAGDSDGVVAAGAWDSVGDGDGFSAGPLGLPFGHGHPTTTGTIRRSMPPTFRRLTSSIPIQDKKAPMRL